MTEIKLFNEWLETNELSTSGISLWYGLMYIANRSGWKPVLCIPVSALTLRTSLSRSAIYRERTVLRDLGLIDFEINDGRQSSYYRIRSFEEQLSSPVVSQTETQNGMQRGMQPTEAFQVVSHPETQPDAQPEDESQVMSPSGTQSETQCPEASHTGTQSGNIYKLNTSSDLKKGSKSKSKKKGEDIDLTFIEDPVWRNIVGCWLDYKKSRNEGYKSELSARKFLTQIKNMARSDPGTAQQIIDNAIARNWAGIFPLDSTKNKAGVPATGQRIGQIKQPDEQRREKLLEKFGQQNT